MSRPNAGPAWTILAFAFALTAAAQPAAVPPVRLPAPSGPYGVGRETILCQDRTRLEPLAPAFAPRRILVDLWYPADPTPSPNPTPAAYLDLAAFEHHLGADRLRSHLGPAYGAIRSGQTITHAYTLAPFARSIHRAPILLFSPGGGMIRELYTVQLADLASHGYIVAAMTHSYDGFLTVFPDGSSVTHDARRWPKIPSVEGEANRNQLEWHTADMLTVLEHLRRLNRTPNSPSPVSGHLDLGRVGAFGHSFGGVTAAHACQSEPQIRACLNQDGAMGMNPFYRTDDGWGMDQAFLLIERPPNRDPLTPADLAALKMTREQAAQLIAHLNANRDRTFRSTGKGSYRVLLRRNETTHIDFTDLPLLSASNHREWEHRRQVVELIQRYTRAFFDKHVRGNKAPVLDQHTPSAILESVEIFPPAKKPKHRTSGQSPN